jgi:ubiquinone/menaquinone biosynthesis C-methylase UbiE
VVEEGYNALAKVYDRNISRSIKGYKNILEKIAIAVSGCKSILDFGTGTATLPVMICKNNEKTRILGIDSSEKMLEIAKEKIEKENLHGRIKLVLDNKIDTNEKFDAITCAFTIYLLDREKMINDFSKHLKKGGLLVLTDVCYDDIFGKFGKKFVRIAQAIKGFPRANLYSLDEVKKNLENDGFKNVKIEKVGNFFLMSVYLITAFKS